MMVLTVARVVIVFFIFVLFFCFFPDLVWIKKNHMETIKHHQLKEF